jgi:hypothetical protein
LGTRQQELECGGRRQCGEEAQARDNGSHLFIHRRPAFAVQFAHRDVRSPVFAADMTKAAGGEVGCFSDAHAGQALQQQSVGEQIVAAAQLGLQAEIVFRRQNMG